MKKKKSLFPCVFRREEKVFVSRSEQPPLPVQPVQLVQPAECTKHGFLSRFMSAASGLPTTLQPVTRRGSAATLLVPAHTAPAIPSQPSSSAPTAGCTLRYTKYTSLPY